MAGTALTPKKERFCLEYIQDYNATQAAIRAKYSPKSAAKTGCQLLKEPEVRAYIEQLQREARERLMLNHDRVILELVDVVNICKSAVPVEKWDYLSHEMVETGEYQIDSKGAVKALELIGRHLGMFDKQDIPTGDTGPVFYTGEDELKE